MNGVPVVAGATYLEIGRLAASLSVGQQPNIQQATELRHIVWRHPLAVTVSEKKTIYFSSLKQSLKRDKILHIKFSHQKMKTQVPPIVAEGVVVLDDAAASSYRSADKLPSYNGSEAIKARCTHHLSSEIIYDYFSNRGLEYGDSFRGIEHLSWRR